MWFYHDGPKMNTNLFLEWERSYKADILLWDFTIGLIWYLGFMPKDSML
jgi:hypothetical protein